MPLLGSERERPERLPVARVPWYKWPVLGQLLPGDLTQLVPEHVAEAFTAIDREPDGRVGDHVVVSVPVLGE